MTATDGQTDTVCYTIIWYYLHIFWILCRNIPLTWSNNFKTTV